MDIKASDLRQRGLSYVALAATILLVSCFDQGSTDLHGPSPFLVPTSVESPAFSARLPELLPVAQVDREVAAVDFAELGDAEPLLFEGWSLEPDLGAAWGTGGVSSLDFAVVPARDLVLRLRCAPFHYRRSPRQTVTVVVNGQEIDSIRLWRMTRSYSVDVPAQALTTGLNRLEFRYSFSAVPAEVVGDPVDTRSLAVMWRSIRLVDRDADVQPPRASPDGTRLDLPFASKVNYYLRLGSDSALRVASVDVWGDEGAVLADDIRLRLEATVDPGLDVRVVELAPARLDGPFEFVLPVDTAGQLARLSIAAYRLDGRATGVQGLTLDLPEVVSRDPALAPDAPVQVAGTGRRPVDRPNILVYMVDTLRADHLGVYGYEVPTSPNIDRFATDATLFGRSLAQTSWTRPAVASVFTGLHPQAHGTNGRLDALSQDAETVAEMLSGVGYETAAIFTNANLFNTGLDQGFDTYLYLREGAHDATYVLSDELHDMAVQWLDKRERDRPFFLYLHAADPHSPYTPPPGFLERIGKRVENPEVGLLDNVAELEREVVDEARLADLVALYDAEIAFNDHSFGRLLEELRRRGLYDTTMIVLVSDHGEEFFDHGWWQHGKTLYEEQLAVPLIIRFPGGVGAGERDDRIAQHIDLLPTMLDLAGLESPDRLEGRSLYPGAAPRTGPVFAMSYLSVDDRVAESLTWDDAKLVLHHYDHPWGRLLFDLSSDPGETVNLWSERPVLAGYLLSSLKAFEIAQQVRLEPEAGEFDEEQIERLRALGYLN
jgi:arylsulfatase A-like enzyme